MNHHPAAEPAWTAGEVARRLGIPLATLRSWNRRYDLGPSDHEPGRYRRFTEADIAVLDRMRRLIAGGMRPASAAVLAGSGHPTGQLWADAPALTTRLVDELLIAARELDDAVLGHRLDRALVQHGVVRVWERLLVPALTRLGDEIGDTTRCIEIEHLLSWSIQASLHRVSPPSRAGGTPVLLACTPGERHTLPLEALCAALAERGVRTGVYYPTPIHRLPAYALDLHLPATDRAAAEDFVDLVRSEEGQRVLREHGFQAP
jgi:DNA-binding transcriptional MerR regulator